MKNKLLSLAIMSVLLCTTISTRAQQSGNNYIGYILTKEEVRALKSSTTEKDPAIKIYDVSGSSIVSKFVAMPAVNRAGYPTTSQNSWYKGGKRCPPSCDVNIFESDEMVIVPEREQASLQLATSYIVIPPETINNFLASRAAEYLYIEIMPGKKPSFTMAEDFSEITETANTPIGE